MIHLDTNFLIRALATGTSEEAEMLIWLEQGETIGASVMAWAEFLSGPLHSGERELADTFIQKIEPLSPADAEKAAELFNATGRRSRSLADCLIAAVALRLGASLATANADDFNPFVPHGLVLA